MKKATIWLTVCMLLISMLASCQSAGKAYEPLESHDAQDDISEKLDAYSRGLKCEGEVCPETDTEEPALLSLIKYAKSVS